MKLTTNAFTTIAFRGKHAAAAFAAALLFAVPLTGTAQQIGGNLNSSGGFDDGIGEIRSTLSAYFESRPPIEDTLALRYLVEPAVTYSNRAGEDDERISEVFFDVQNLYLEVISPGTIADNLVGRLRAGRFRSADRSGLVFDDRLDGLSLSADHPRFGLSLLGGYTGLVGEMNSSIAMSAADAAARADPDEIFAPPRVVLIAESDFPDFLARQTLTIGAAAQFDTRDLDDEEVADTVDSQYGSLTFDGPLLPHTYYELSGAISAAQVASPEEQEPTALGLAGRAEVEHYVGGGDASVVSLEGEYAAGLEAEEPGYLPIAPRRPDVLAPPALSDSIFVKLDYAIRPFSEAPGAGLRSLEASVYGAAGFRASEPESGDRYQGTETGLRFAARPLSDLGARAAVAGVIPPAADEDPEILGRIELSTSF